MAEDLPPPVSSPGGKRAGVCGDRPARARGQVDPRTFAGGQRKWLFGITPCTPTVRSTTCDTWKSTAADR
jgi:hypothetical protein